MYIKIKIWFFIIVLSFFTKIIIAQDCEDTQVDIQTPRGTNVPDTYETCEFQDPYFNWREYYDSVYAANYPNATQIKLPGEQYSSTRTFNCHGYAWWYVEEGERVWIGAHYARSEEVFFEEPTGDGSYDEVSEAVCTKISYSGDHSAIPSGSANYYYSKWRWYPLMYHHKDYHPGYGTANQFFRRSVDVPEDYSSIASAISSAVSGQTVHVSNNQTITSNITVPSSVTLTINSGLTINFQNGASLIINGTLDANVTSGSNVTFTNSGGGSWGGVIIGNGGSADINYANIQNATTGVKFESGSSGSVSNSTLSNNTYGIYISANAYPP